MKTITPKNLLNILNSREDVFCHISTRIYKDNKFEPRIPENLYMYNDEEDSEIDRVCVSSSLEGAFLGIPQGGYDLYSWYEDNAMYFKVFIIDCKKLNISKNNIYKPEYLVEKGYVLDAIQTQEHWILEEFEVPEEYTFLINLKDWNMSENNDLLKIENLNFTTEYVYPNEIVDFDLDYIKEEYKEPLSLKNEKEKLKSNFLKLKPNITFLDKEEDYKISFKFDKKECIKDLMEFDSYYKSKIYNDRLY